MLPTAACCPTIRRCPYLAFAQYNLSTALPGVPPSSIDWFANLTAMAPVADPNSTATIQRLQALNVPWINSWIAANNITAGAPVGGAYYQLLSQIPGVGPCYPIWVATSTFFSRCPRGAAAGPFLGGAQPGHFGRGLEAAAFARVRRGTPEEGRGE